MSPYPYLYNAFGLTIGSELECPELFPLQADVDDNAAVDLAISLGELPPVLENATHSTPRLQAGDRVFQLSIEGVARFRGIDGAVIIVDPLPGAGLGDVRLLLLGWVLGSVLHQRGWLPLHASAVSVDGNAVAFCGSSGAGKSTLSAMLQRMGHPLLCDDVAVIRTDYSGLPRLYPGVRRLKLWKEALDHFEVDHSGLARTYSWANKFNLELRDAINHQPSPLSAIYLLESSPKISSVTIGRILAADSVGTLLNNTYRFPFLHRLGNPSAHLHQCARIAGAIPVFRYQSPRDLASLESSSKTLLAHIRSLP